MKPASKKEDTFDLRMEGMPWLRDANLKQVYEAVEAAYKSLPNIDDDRLFLIEKTDSGEEKVFCMDHIMWEALCGSPRDMGMYLDMFWEHDDDQ